MSHRVEFYRHDLGKPELDAIAGVLAGPILTTGDTVAQFEREFAALLGCKHALGVTSCTGAMHMALLALGVGAGDEVITTPMTFIATSKTCAILPVHLYGQMCDMREIRRVADRHHLAVVEDAAHCVEGVRDGVRPGQLGDVACFSFYATKSLTCGEGGALVTNRDDLLPKLKLLRLHGMTKTAADRQREGYRHWDMVSLGWKYNLDNIHAAMLLAQLPRLARKLEQRHALARRYEERLASVEGVRPVRALPGVVHARHVFPVRVANGKRDAVIGALAEAGIPTVVNYRAIHLLTWFAEHLGHEAGQFPVAERIGDEVLSLPYYPGMPEEHLDLVVEALRAAVSARSAGRR